MINDLYRDRATRMDTIIGEAPYWKLLQRLNEVYAQRLHNDPQWDDFSAWCEQEHGFRPKTDDDGGIISRPEIMDQAKYTVCLLKYGG